MTKKYPKKKAAEAKPPKASEASEQEPKAPPPPARPRPSLSADDVLLADLLTGAQEELEHPSSELAFADPFSEEGDEAPPPDDSAQDRIESVTPEIVDGYDGDEADEAEQVGGEDGEAHVLESADLLLDDESILRTVDRGQKLVEDGLTITIKMEPPGSKAPLPQPLARPEDDPDSNVAAHVEAAETLQMHATETLRKHPSFTGRLRNVEKLKCWPDVKRAMELGYRFAYIARMIHSHGEWKDMRPDEITLVLNHFRAGERRRALPGTRAAQWRISDAEPFPVAPEHVPARDLNSIAVAICHDMLMQVTNDIKRTDSTKNPGALKDVREFLKVFGALTMQSAELEERERKALLSSAPPKPAGDVVDMINAQREHYAKVYGKAGEVILDPVARRRVLTVWEKIKGYMNPAVQEALEANKKEFAKIEKAAQARRERMDEHERRMAREASGEVEEEPEQPEPETAEEPGDEG